MDVAVVVTAHKPSKESFRPADYCAKAEQAFVVLKVMLADAARLWTFDELASKTGIKRDLCRRIVNAAIKQQMLYEGQGGYMIAPHIRELQRKYVVSLEAAEDVAKRQRHQSGISGFIEV